MALPPVFSEDIPIYKWPSRLLFWISNSDSSTFTDFNCPTVTSVNVRKLNSLFFPLKPVASHTLLILRMSSTSPQLLKIQTWKLCLTLLLISHYFFIDSNSFFVHKFPFHLPLFATDLIISLLRDAFENLMNTTNSTFPPHLSSAYTLPSSFWRLRHYLPMKATLLMFESWSNLF